MPPEHAHCPTHERSVGKVYLARKETEMFRLVIKKRGYTNGCRTYPGAAIMTGLVAILICVLLAGNAVVWGQAENSTARIIPPDGFRASGAPEIYDPDTLYQKINGQAELYLSAGFVSLESQWYEAVADADSIIEVNLYHMGGLMNAFSVFSLQRRDTAQTIDVTPFAYQTEKTIYMVHGPYYVEILSTLPSGTHISTLKQLAERFIRDTPVDKRDLHLLSVFPSENLVEGSASMIARDAFGFDLLDNVFTFAYDADAGRSTAYVSKRKSAEEARTLVSKLHNFFTQYGGRSIETDIGVEGARMIEIMGTFEVMFSFGEYFAGVHEAPDRNQAKKVAILLAGSLKKKTGETTY